MTARFNLGVGERRVLFENDSMRIVGEGIAGWGTNLTIERKQKDTMGDPYWQRELTIEHRESFKGSKEDVIFTLLAEVVGLKRKIEAPS